MLWGTALVAVPVLIHLINRRRYVVRSFAAMAFLRLAFQRQRRRLRMESLLLLLLRCLVVLLAALAMALPQVGGDSPLAILSGGRREVVLVVDRSGSTARRLPGGGTLEQRILERLRRQVEALSDERGDAVTLLTPGAGPLLPAPIGATPGQVLAVLDAGLPPVGGVADLLSAARLLAERVRPLRTGYLDVTIYSDLQDLSWGEGLGPLLAEVLDDGGGSLRVVDAAADAGSGANLGVLALSADERLLLAGRPFGVSAIVANHGDLARAGVSGSFLLDGQLQRRVTLEPIGPRGQGVATARLRIDAPGAHHVSFVLDPDELGFDDQRSLALDVSAGREVLLVDGSHAGARLDRATGWIELALDPGAAGIPGDDLLPSGFVARVTDVAAFEDAGRELYRPDAIVLADVGGLSRAAAENLAEVVSAGTPLLLFTGENVVPSLWDERLYATGLLPARVGAPLGAEPGAAVSDYVTLVLADPPPPALALFADPRLSVLLQVPITRWSPLTPRDDATVLASFADALGHTSPALVEHRLGEGRVLLLATSADDSWSLLPRQPATWVPLIHELLGSLLADDPARVNVPEGQAPALLLDAIPERLRLTAPDGSVEEFAAPEHERLGERCRLTLPGPLVPAGAWMLAVEPADPNRAPFQLALASLPEAREGDLLRVDGATLAQRLAGVEFTLGEAVTEEDGEAEPAGADGSLFRALLWALLAAALGESLLARVMGRAR